MRASIYTLLGASLLILSPTVAAQDFPVRPIQVVVPYAAGGGTDLSARVMADAIGKYLDGIIVIRNQPGGSGSIGTSAIVHARPDGHTLGMGAQGPLVMLPHYGGIDYSIDDIEFIALMGRSLMVVAGCAGAPFEDGEAFLDHARENPGRIQVGNSGAGGANHIAMAGLASAAGVEVSNMPFSGASEAVTACVGGHVDAIVAHPSEILPQAQAGGLIPLLVMEEERTDQLPDVPTTLETGIDFTWSSWRGVVAPKGIPDDVRSALSDALEKTFNDEEFLSRMADLGEDIEYQPGGEYEELARRDYELAEEIIRDLGMHGMNQ